jgi:metallophosphoesterase superfamily enzyme
MKEMSQNSQHRLRVAVITDLHYSYDKVSVPPRFLPQCAIGQEIDPMLALTELMREKNITAQLLLCPGDIADKADHAAFKFGWDELKKLKTTLKAEQLIASTGNHEVDSRPSESPQNFASLASATLDPIGQLQGIEDYPADFSCDPDRRWVYWGRGYEIIETNDAYIIVINSCHFHVTMSDIEYDRGKIGSVALTLLQKELKGKNLDEKKFRLVLLHHHPIPHEDLSLDLGRIEMLAGTKLIEILENTYNDWLIIHGHKHLPRLIKAQGSTSPPIVFAAGSFGAALGTLACKTKNQFYILELEASKNQVNKYQLRGKVEAYYWANDQWRLSTEKGHGLPYGCGFDRNIDPDNLSGQVQQAVNKMSNGGKTYVRWNELCEQLRELNYLMPAHIEHLRTNLRGLGVKFEDEHQWFPTDLS